MFLVILVHVWWVWWHIFVSCTSLQYGMDIHGDNVLDMGVVPERPNNEILWIGVLDAGERRIHFET